ncbi:MAG: hypothetical protein R3Y36_04350 [Spirochaetales bacterium]
MSYKFFTLGFYFCLCVTILHSQASVSSDGRLRYFEAGDEHVFVGSDYASLVHASDDRLVQKQYDDLYRLSKETVWLANAISPESVRMYSYESDGAFPMVRTTDNLLTALFTEEVYNESGLLVDYKEYTENATNNEKNKLVYQKMLDYDSENRLIAETYAYATAQSEKVEYMYLQGEHRGDQYRYENDALVSKIIYTSVDDWEETIYFPNNIEVKTIYRDNDIFREEFYQNGIKIRESN